MSKPILKYEFAIRLIKNRIKFITSGQTEAIPVNHVMIDEYQACKEEQKEEDVLRDLINNIAI